MVTKVGQQLGPKTTTTSADNMKAWPEIDAADDPLEDFAEEPETDSSQE